MSDSGSAQAATDWKRRTNSKTKASKPVPSATPIAIIASRFNEPLVENLVQGARLVLAEAGIREDLISVHWGPGSFELSGMAAQIARRSNPPKAIIALGVLIRGETVQYEVIANAVACGLTEVSVRYGVPVSFGVVVASDLEQAKARCGKRENRGEEAAYAVLSVLASGCDGD